MIMKNEKNDDEDNYLAATAPSDFRGGVAVDASYQGERQTGFSPFPPPLNSIIAEMHSYYLGGRTSCFADFLSVQFHILHWSEGIKIDT